MATTEEKVIEIGKIDPATIIVTIVGDGDIICNKMNDVVTRNLIDVRKDKAKKVAEKPNEWEEVITSVHWRDGKPETDPKTWTGSTFAELNKNNAPCISAFGFAKSLNDAVVRFGFETYSTKFRAAVNVVSSCGLIPFKFADCHIDEKLMSPKKGAPILSRQVMYSGWSADITIRFIDSLYSAEQIVNIINCAGFGLGIGSGRSSGFGRYHVSNVVAYERG